MKTIINKINSEIKNKINECWGYHKDELKANKWHKQDIGSLDVSPLGWEDIMFFEGVIYGLELAKDMIIRNNEKK